MREGLYPCRYAGMEATEGYPVDGAARFRHKAVHVHLLRSGLVLLFSSPLLVKLVRLAEPINAVGGLDEAIGLVDALDDSGVDDAVGEVRVAHEVARQTLSRFQLAEAVEDEIVDDGPVLNFCRQLIHTRGPDLSAGGRDCLGMRPADYFILWQ